MRGTLTLFTLLSICLFARAQDPSPLDTTSIYNAYRINSSDYEFSPTYYLDGVVYVAVQQDDPKKRDNTIPFFELYYAPLAEDGMPSNHRPFSNPLNSLQHEGQAAFTAKGDLIYYTGNSQIKNDAGKYTMKIYEARKEGTTWSNVVDLPINSEAFSNRHPSISSDGMTLYFASNMPGGFGGSDIYVVKKEGTYWGIPQNLGPQVNTPENDAFPFIYKNQYLFFSSKGHDGNGDYDIYAINIEDGLLGPLIHLDENFNSPNADFGFILDEAGNKGFFSSNREGGFGKDDIYLFESPQGFFSSIVDSSKKIIQEAPTFTLDQADVAEEPSKIVQVQEVVKDITSKEDKVAEQVKSTPVATPIPDKPSEFSTTQEPEVFTAKSVQCATFKGVLASSKGNPLAMTEVVIRSSCGGLPYTVLTDQAGAFESCLPINCQYIVASSKEGFQKNDVMIEVTAATQFNKRLELTPINNTPNFPTAQLTDQLTIGSIMDFQSLAYDLEQAAHYNYELSQARAQIFKSHLVQQGNIAPNRIKAVGMGEQQLRNHCNGTVPCSDAEHQENRRTEVKVTKLAGTVAITNW